MKILWQRWERLRQWLGKGLIVVGLGGCVPTPLRQHESDPQWITPQEACCADPFVVDNFQLSINTGRERCIVFLLQHPGVCSAR